MKGLFLTTTVIGTGLLMYAARNLYHQYRDGELMGEPIHEKVEKKTLAEVSRTWSKALSGNIVEFREIAKLWRESETEQAAVPLPRPTFKHREIERFFSEMIEKRRTIKGDRRRVIVKLLKLLDEEGDCPSVVNMNPLEAEKKYSKDTFSMLATIPLYLHTIQVARKFATKVNQDVMLPDIFIVSLGHDIGKIPSYHDKMYSTVDHPLISAIVLNGITEYASLSNRDELDKIIREHHLLKADYPLTKMLKQCDQDVRKEELAVLVGEAVDRDKTSVKTEDAPPRKPERQADTQKPVAKNGTPPEDEQDHPLGVLETQELPDLEALELPSWFDADAILSAVNKRINQLEATSKGLRWSAVSTTSGLVFANPEGLWAAVKEVSGKDPVMLAADADEATKRNLLYTFVRELSRVKDAIATEYVSEKHYTTKVTIVTGAGKGINSLLVPFRTRAFGISSATLEMQKSPLLKKMVKDIKPKQEEVETCVF
jgi:hypothetical protein